MTRGFLCGLMLFVVTASCTPPTMLAQMTTGSGFNLPSEQQESLGERPPVGSQPLRFDRVLHLFPVAHAPVLGSDRIAALSPRQKFELFNRTTIDPSVALIAVVGAGASAQGSAQPAFGGGAAAFGQKVGSIAADYGSTAFFSRAMLPILFRQDPRFFRRDSRHLSTKLLYGLTRVFVTQTDYGRSTINTSFLGGCAMSVALSNAYYPDRNRNARDSAARYGLEIGIGAAVDVVREFRR